MDTIEKKDLLEEIKTALCDEFVAEITKEEESLLLRFFGGQTFRLTLEEIK